MIPLLLLFCFFFFVFFFFFFQAEDGIRDLTVTGVQRCALPISQQQVAADTALLDYVADRPMASVRSLSGVVQRLLAAAAAQDPPLTAGLAREVLEGQPAEPGRRTAGFRTSGLVVSSLGGIRSREKMVWDWPDPADRIVEDLR